MPAPATPSTPTSSRVSEIRAILHAFIGERLAAKLEKLSEDDPTREALLAKYQPEAWLADAAKRVAQIQAATHAIKATHPDARGTNPYILPAQLTPRLEVGSHVLGESFTPDIVGNAGALDVYRFLKLEIGGGTLLEALEKGDPDVLAALDDNIEVARVWRDAFVSLVPGLGQVSPASHTLAKQLYWLVGEDPCDDTAYHLLGPLYATSFAHQVYHMIQNDRFGEEAQKAREARRKNEIYDGVIHDYPNLAVQKLGSSKPQTVSHLNLQRRGYNYLLSCAAPNWKTPDLPSLNKASSFFDSAYGSLPDVRKTLSDFLRFLRADPAGDMDTRNRRDAYIDILIDELVQLAARYQQGWEPGWSRAPEIDLPWEECLWLDPYRALIEGEEEFRKDWEHLDWPNQIGERFGRWLNAMLEQYLPVGDIEFRHWRKELLLDENQGGWAQQLHRQIKKVGVPIYMPKREP